jgi:hypothetical protein
MGTSHVDGDINPSHLGGGSPGLMRKKKRRKSDRGTTTKRRQLHVTKNRIPSLSSTNTLSQIHQTTAPAAIKPMIRRSVN